ncbi:MAG: SPOR domain-containing protein [Thiohalocapsa sp.]
MPQALSDYDRRDDEFAMTGEERSEELPARDRRLPMLLLTMLAMALFAGGLYFAYTQGTRHAGVAQSNGVPLLRAEERPSKVKPDQPGGMAIPDQNVSLYNEKPGGPAVEKLLPAPEQPLPRPAPPPPTLAPKEPAATAATQPAPTPAAAPPPESAPERATAPETAAAQPAPPPALAAAAAGRIHLRLGSLRSPDAAREEWARLKRENPDLLGKLRAVAIRTDLGDKGIYYRIQAGSFGDAAPAERLCEELKRRNFGCILAR